MRDILAEIRLRIENAKKSSIIRGPMAPSAVREKKNISLRDIVKLDREIAQLDREIAQSRAERRAEEIAGRADKRRPIPVPKAIQLKRDLHYGLIDPDDYFDSRLFDIAARRGTDYARRVWARYKAMK